MPTSSEKEVAYKQLKILRKKFDTMRKDFGGIPTNVRGLADFARMLIPLIDDATKTAGILPFPVVIPNNSTNTMSSLESINSKGNVRRRKITLKGKIEGAKIRPKNSTIRKVKTQK